MMQSREPSPSNICRDACIRLRAHCRLDLGHGRTFADSTTTRGHAAAGAQTSNKHGSNESGEHKPVEGGAGLELAASLGSVVGTVCQAVAEEVGLVGARVYVKLSRQYNTSNEAEDCRKTIQDQKDEGNGQGLNKGCHEAEKDHKHTENRCKHSIVDAGRVSGEGISNNIADQGHGE